MSAPIEGFSCPVCLEDYSEGRLPLTIYCGHSTCAICLAILEDTGDRTGCGNLCPTCRQPFGPVASLRPNFALLDAITAHIEFVSAQPLKAVSVKDLSMEDLRAEFARREAEAQQQVERQAELRADLARREAVEAEELARQEQRERERLEDLQWALELAAAVARDEEKARARQEQQLAAEEAGRRKKAEKKARRREAVERAANEVEERRLVAAAVLQEREEREEDAKRAALALEEERRREQREEAARLREAGALERQRAEEAELAVTEERQQAQRQKKAAKKARDKAQREDAKLLAKKSHDEEWAAEEEIARKREAQVFERRRADEAAAAAARLQHGELGGQPECAFCGKSAAASLIMRCVRCRQAIYCDQDCQRRHWSTHKLSCKPSGETATSLRPQPPAPSISAIASYFQATWMVDARDVCRLPMTRAFVSLRAKAKYDAFACVLALLQAVPGLSSGSLGATLSQCLLRAEGDSISIGVFAALDDGVNDIRDEGDLVAGTASLLWSTFSETTRAPAPVEFCVIPPPPTDVTTLKVQIPSAWRPGEKLLFSPRFNLSYSLSPAAGSKAGDVLSVKVKESVEEVVHNPPLSRSLQRFASRKNGEDGGVLTIGTSRDCAHCHSSSSFGDVERNARLELRVEPQPRVSLEELLSNESQEDRGACHSCRANAYTLGGNKWYFSQQSQCYVRDDSPKTECEHVPGAKGQRTWIASLPSILCIELSRHTEYSHDTGDLLMSYTAVDYPVRNLDMRPFFHPELPAPADACTVYDLRYMGLMKHSQKTEVTELCAQAARERRAIPILKGRYCGFAMSLVDDGWYQFDVCDPHVAVHPPADRIACSMVRVLVYQRRDVV